MIPILASLFTSPLSRKILLYSGLVVMLFLGLRWYSNKAFSDGRSAGVNAALSESITASSAGWKSDLNDLQQKLVTSQQNTLAASQAAASAASKADQAQLASARAQLAIHEQVQATPTVSLPTLLVDNDPALSNHTSDVEPLQRALLQSQMVNKEYKTELDGIMDTFNEYKDATNAQISGLKDQLTATQGQLKVMTTERDAYKASFEAATKKRGCGSIKKVFTLGICR